MDKEYMKRMYAEKVLRRLLEKKLISREEYNKGIVESEKLIREEYNK